MRNKTVELVNQWHEFEKSNPQGELEDFCKFYLARSEQKKVEKSDDPYSHIPLEARLSRTIGRLTRFALFYSRRVLADLELKSLDDFTYLRVLSELGNPRKSEVIEENISEFSSGSEIIKRLIRLGLMEEYPDVEDRRSKRLKITDKGKLVLTQCFERMRGVSEMLWIKLADREKELLYSLLLPVDQLHAKVYQQARNKGIDKIREELAKN